MAHPFHPVVRTLTVEVTQSQVNHAAVIGVDSGSLMVVDPCYVIDDESRREAIMSSGGNSVNGATYPGINDGVYRVVYCTINGRDVLVVDIGGAFDTDEERAEQERAEAEIMEQFRREAAEDGI